MVYLFWVKIEAILHTILQISQIHLESQKHWVQQLQKENAFILLQ